MICIGLKRCLKALELVHNVVTTPIFSIKAVVAESYKTYIPIRTVLRQFSQAHFLSGSKRFEELLSEKVSEIEVYIQAKKEKFEIDQNLKFVKQVVLSMYKRNSLEGSTSTNEEKYPEDNDGDDNLTYAMIGKTKYQRISDLPDTPISNPGSSRLQSINTIENIKKVQVVKALETPEILTVLESPIIHRSPDQTTNVPDSAIFHQYPDQTPNILVAPINPQSPEPANIAPSTPITHSSSSPLRDGPRRTLSSDSLEEECNDDKEIGISQIVEDISTSGGDSWEMNKWSARTRAAARSLCKNFISRKQRKEEEKASIFKILEGKKKGESTLLFYEILVLKSGGYVDVKQQAPYDDIIVSGTCKLKKFCDF